MLKIANTIINENDIIDLSMNSERLIVKAVRNYHLISDSILGKILTIDVKNDSIVPKLKKLLIDRVLREKDPYDRVCDFEWFPSIETRKRLVEMRTTPREKEKEKQETIEWIELYEKQKLDTRFLREELKKKMQGTFRGIE